MGLIWNVLCIKLRCLQNTSPLQNTKAHSFRHLRRPTHSETLLALQLQPVCAPPRRAYYFKRLHGIVVSKGSSKQMRFAQKVGGRFRLKLRRDDAPRATSARTQQPLHRRFRLEGKTTQTLLCLCESEFCFKKTKQKKPLLFTNQTGDIW